jgi:hypothetical protein
MRKTIKIFGKDKNEKLAGIIKTAFPSYRKHAVSVHTSESESLFGTYWSGGSRSDYWELTPDGSKRPIHVSRNPPQFGGPATPPDHSVGNGVAIVEGGFFCGKKCTFSIAIHPDDLVAFGIDSE